MLDRVGQGGQREYELVLAAKVIATLPMLVLLIVFGRYVMQGIAFSGNRE